VLGAGAGAAQPGFFSSSAKEFTNSPTLPPVGTPVQIERLSFTVSGFPLSPLRFTSAAAPPPCARRSAGLQGNRIHGFAGHAGWGPGQLEHEIARGDWHVTAADATMVFEVKASAVWPKLIQQFSGEWTRREAPIDQAGTRASISRWRALLVLLHRRAPRGGATTAAPLPSPTCSPRSLWRHCP
jgi:Uncharacterized ACR, COG1678